MKRILSICLSAALSVSLLAACGQSSAPAAGTESASAAASSASTKASESPAASEMKDVELTMFASQGWIFDIDQTIADEFAEKTGIKVDIQVNPADQHSNLLAAKINGGEAPDIFMIQADKFSTKSQIDPENNCIDLSGEAWVSRMEDYWKPSVTVNGKLYGLPIWNDGLHFVYVYNDKIFTNLGLKVPTTYAEFKDVCAKILASGVTPVYQAVADGWYHHLPLFEIGGLYEDKNPGAYDKLNANQMKCADIPQLEEVLGQFDEFAKLGYFGKDYMSNTVAAGNKAMAEGKAAIMLSDMSLPQTIAKDFPESGAETWGYFVAPWGDNTNLDNVPGGPARFASATSENKDAILEYFNYLASPEVLAQYIQNQPQALKLTFKDVETKFNDKQKAFLDAAAKKQGVVMQNAVSYVNIQWMDVGQDVSAMFAGAMTPKQVVENIDKRRAEHAVAEKDPAWSK